MAKSIVNNDKLVFAHVIFRHGERNIVAPYPNDPYADESHWPEGFGQLTNEGKRQLYRLGQYLRRRYGELIGAKYSVNDIYAQSTDCDRTIMSAQACLAGIYPLTEEEKWQDDLMWQPIPVHTMPPHMDHVLTAGKHCPPFQAAHIKYLKTSLEVRRVCADYADLFRRWSHFSGMTIRSIDAVNKLYNILTIEKERKKLLPEWAEEAIHPDSPMGYISNLYLKSYADTPELASLRQGFLIKEMMLRFTLKMNTILEPDRSLWLYSAHDSTIINLLNALKLFEMHTPPYGASMHFDLYRTSDNRHYFQVFYRKSEEEYPKALSVPGCGDKCSLKQFYDLYQEIIPDKFENELKDYAESLTTEHENQ